MDRIRLIVPVLLFLLSTLTTHAEAHLLVSQSALFSGLAQPFFHMIGLIFLLAFGLLAGMTARKHQSSEHFLIIPFFVMVVLGSIIPFHGIGERSSSLVMLSVTLGMTVLVCADKMLPLSWMRVWSVLNGLLTALFFVDDLGFSWIKQIFFTAGFMISVFVVIYPVSHFVGRCNSPALIVVRVVSSWLFAMSAMILAAFLTNRL